MEGANPLQNNNNTNDENRTLNEPHFSFGIFRRTPFFSPFSPFRDLTLNSPREENSGRTSFRIISSTYSNVGRNSEYAPQPTINSDEIRETIAQNLLEVQNMIDCGNYNEFNEEKENKE